MSSLANALIPFLISNGPTRLKLYISVQSSSPDSKLTQAIFPNGPGDTSSSPSVLKRVSILLEGGKSKAHLRHKRILVLLPVLRYRLLIRLAMKSSNRRTHIRTPTPAARAGGIQR